MVTFWNLYITLQSYRGKQWEQKLKRAIGGVVVAYYLAKGKPCTRAKCISWICDNTSLIVSLVASPVTQSMKPTLSRAI